jgi:SAM-dependent methyltransferase
VSDVDAAEPWTVYLQRYRAGQWRDRIFHDMILTDAERLGPQRTILDIGCGAGFDGSVPLQQSIAGASGRFIGVEPDPAVPLGDYFSETHRCTLEEAPLAAGSIDLAYSVMVLEHLPHPQPFWDKLHEVLGVGGVFWGLTIDARHLFSRLSLCADRLGVKNFYLDRVLGPAADQGRYQNYPTHYRTNRPRHVQRLARAFRSCDCISFSRVGQWSAFLPRGLRGLADHIDRIAIRRGWPGTLLIIRAIK